MRRATNLVAAMTVLGAIATGCGGDDDGGVDIAGDTVPSTGTDAPVGADDPGPTGDGADAAQPADEQPDAEQPATEQPDAEQPDAEQPDGGSAGEDAAIVTIGEQTFRFDVTPGAVQRCDPNFFGAFWAIGASADGSGVELLLPPDGDPNFEEAPYVKIDVGGADTEWVARPDDEFNEYPAGSSQVDDFTVDGTTVTGSATFIDSSAWFVFRNGNGPEPEPVAGTFEVRCADS